MRGTRRVLSVLEESSVLVGDSRGEGRDRVRNACMLTLRAGSDALLDAGDAVLEFLLGDAQVLVGICQVLDFLVELLLDLGQLLDAQRIQIDYISGRKAKESAT